MDYIKTKRICLYMLKVIFIKGPDKDKKPQSFAQTYNPINLNE